MTNRAINNVLGHVLWYIYAYISLGYMSRSKITGSQMIFNFIGCQTAFQRDCKTLLQSLCASLFDILVSIGSVNPSKVSHFGEYVVISL